MEENDLVRICPLCASHPPFPPHALRCETCGGTRPKRLAITTWHGSQPEARQRGQDALDLALHSAMPNATTTFVELQCREDIYLLLDVRLAETARPSIDARSTGEIILCALTRHGLKATRPHAF